MHAMKLLLLFLFLLAEGSSGHPLCYFDDRSTDYNEELTFCPAAQDGACCTDAEELAVEALFDAAGTLSDSCADLHKQVVCGVCHSYSAHLYERLGNELGGADGMTMKESFCEQLVKECSGEIKFPTYDGLSYCDKHVGSGGDQFWSYPYTEPEIFDTGLTEVFPDLDTDLDFPANTLSIHQSPDGSMYWLMGQLGEVKKVGVENPGEISTVVDISGGEFYSGYEEGLLDFAFGPMFGVEGYPQYFYLSHTVILDDGERQRNRLSKFEYFAGDPTETRESEEILITGSPRYTDIHAAGWCGFKPSAYGEEASYHDLYWSTGDSGPQQDPNNNGQDASNILGSMIRISVPTNGDGYEIPSGNLGGSSDVLPEICANGFRNPFRCGFDRLTDTLYCGDVGHTMVEEVDIVECGKNYGWSRFEGSRCQEAEESRDGPCADADRSGFEFPFFEYCHVDYHSTSEGEDVFLDGEDICGDRTMTGHAIIGGYVYRGTYFADLIFGSYIFGDSTNRNIYYIKEEDGELVTGTIVSDGSVAIISFAEDINGEIMMITKTHSLYHMPCGDLCASTSTGSPPTTCLGQSESHSSYQDIGCFVDATKDRVLSLAEGVCDSGSRTMSPEICASYCATIPGAVYFGVEYSYECFCGGSDAEYDKLGTLSSSDCDYECTNNDEETCGGYYAIQVYEFE